MKVLRSVGEVGRTCFFREEAEEDWPYLMDRLSDRCDADDLNLCPFKKRSEMLIQYHNIADPLVSPFPMMEYDDYNLHVP